MSDRRRKNLGSKLALELKAKDVISLERDEDGQPIRFTVEKVIAHDKHVAVTGKCTDGKSHTHLLDWRKEVQLYLPPKKDRRYAFLLWLAKHLDAPVKRA